jgi:hypothetical protein
MFRAPRLALGRRMLVILEALLASYGVLLLFSYIALLIDGQAFGSIWTSYHLLPPLFVVPVSGLVAKLVFYLAYAFMFIATYLGFTAVAKITIKEFKGDLFYSSKDGWSWAMKHWFPVFFGPLAIAIVIAFFVVLAIIFGWLAQWPVLDIIFYGLLFAIFLPTGIFLAYSLVSFVVGAIMSPSIVACAEEDTMGSMFGAYTLLWNQPMRLLSYLGILAVLAFLGYHIFGLFVLSGFKLLEMVFGLDWLMGGAFVAIKEVGVGLFGAYDFLPSYFQVPNCLAVLFDASATGTSVTQSITGVLVGVVSLIAYLAIPAYGLATIATGLAIEFIVLTKYKDDDDLIKRKDEDERAEEEEEEEADGQADEEVETADATAESAEDEKPDDPPTLS